MIPSKLRGHMYEALVVVSVVAAVALAAAVVLFGFWSQEQVLAFLAFAATLYSAITGLIARLNLTPDEPE